MATHESDLDLLKKFVASRDEAAFAEVTRRYLNMVYATSLRRVRNHHLAEDITQAVFIVLAHKASEIHSPVTLPAWLHKVACYCSTNALRMQTRRHHHERAAAETRTEPIEPPTTTHTELSAHLDDAIQRLGEVDRTIIVTRYLQEHSIEQTSMLAGISIEATKKRSQRAIERLRNLLSRRGVNLSVTALTTLISAEVMQAAPPHLAAGTASSALSDSLSAGSSIPSLIAKGALAMMFWNRIKFAASVAASLAVTVATGALVIAKLNSPPQGAAKVDPPTQVAQVAFGKMSEITINDDGLNKDDCIDFDTGKLTTPGRVFTDRADGANWFKTTGCDAHAETEEGASGLYAMQMIVLPALNEQWDDDAQKIRDQLEVPKERLQLMSADGDLPQTYLFKTREGAVGICQLLAISRDAQQHGTIKLRYKLIEAN